MTRIPIADPRRSFLRSEREIRSGIDRVLTSGRYVGGTEVEAFELELALSLGVPEAVGVASGTDALELALRAVGVVPGDRVATVSLTAVATVAALERAGAVPVLIDVERGALTLDPAGLERELALKPVRAIVPVHLFGQPADLPRIGELARRSGAILIEDCAQADGATLDGRPCGSWGVASAFSFYPTKSLGALGDAGAVVTGDSAVAERIRRLREYGWKERYRSELPGVNSRLDPLQAAILRAKLPRLREALDRRRAIAARYRAEFSRLGLGLQEERHGAESAGHQFVVRTGERERFRSRLDELGVETAIHYPIPIHLQEAYRGRLAIAAGGLPETERACRELVSVPAFAELSDTEVERVIAAVLEAQ